MRNNQFKLLVLLQVVTLFLVGMSFFYGKETNVSEQISRGKPLKEASSGACNDIPAAKENVIYDNMFIYGDTDASNELVVFSRFNCHYCKQFYHELFAYLQNKYVDEGILKIIFIVSANPMDKTEMLMAKSLEVGREKNLYEKMQRTFYSDEFQRDSVSITNLLLQEGITSDLLSGKLENKSVKAHIHRQLKEGERLNITGTPTFFLNGYRMVGYDDKDGFLTFFEAYLNY